MDTSKAMVLYMMGMVPLGIVLPWILQRVYLFLSVHVMLVMPTLTKRLPNKKK